MAILSTVTTFYIAQKRMENEMEKIDPIYYNPTNKSYTPAMEYNYATKYATLEEVSKRVTILNMLAELDGSEQNPIEYISVKRTETTEEIEAV